MTVAFDAFGSPTTNTGGGTNPQVWTHTPVGTPAGVAVLIQAEATTALTVSSVKYGTVAMTPHADSPLTGGEGANNRLWIFTLYENIPTGPQTVTVTYGGTPGAGTNCRSITLTADAPLETHAAAHADTTTANPKISVACTKDSVVLGMLNSGQDTAAAVSADANTTSFGGVQDVGGQQHAFARKTAIVTAGNTDGPGWTVASSAALMYAIAVAEAGGTEQSTGGTIAGDGALAGVAIVERATGGAAAGAGATAGAAARDASVDGAIAGDGALSATGAREATTGATLAGDSALAGDASVSRATGGASAGSGELVGAATASRATGGASAGAGELAGSAAIEHATGAAVTGTGALAGVAAFEFATGGAVTGSGTLAGTALRDAKAAASIAAVAELVGQALRDGLTGGQISAAGQLALAGTVVERFAGGTVDGTGLLAGRALSVRAHPPLLPFASALTIDGRGSDLAVTTHDSTLEVST